MKLTDFPPQAVQNAREVVAKDWAEMVQSVRKEDPFASHVTEAEKDDFLAEGLSFAKSIAKGWHDNNFTIWQRLIEILTGKCPALLP